MGRGGSLAAWRQRGVGVRAAGKTSRLHGATRFPESRRRHLERRRAASAPHLVGVDAVGLVCHDVVEEAPAEGLEFKLRRSLLLVAQNQLLDQVQRTLGQPVLAKRGEEAVLAHQMLEHAHRCPLVLPGGGAARRANTGRSLPRCPACARSRKERRLESVRQRAVSPAQAGQRGYHGGVQANLSHGPAHLRNQEQQADLGLVPARSPRQQRPCLTNRGTGRQCGRKAALRR